MSDEGFAQMKDSRLRGILSAWPIAIAIALLALVQFENLPARPKFLSVINNFAHGPVFGAVAVLLLAWIRPRVGKHAAAYAFAFVFATAAGLAVEWLQILTHRDASYADAITNALGAGAALCLVAFWDMSRPPLTTASYGRYLTLCAGALQLMILLAPVGVAIRAYVERTHRFPTVLEFGSETALYFVELRDCEAAPIRLPQEGTAHDGRDALLIRFSGKEWPGISAVEPVPDWRGYRRLRIDVANPGPADIGLGVRVDEIGHGLQYSDRYNAVFMLRAGTSQVLDVMLEDVAAAPRHGRLDLARVGELVLFRASSATARKSEIILTRVWLE
jgi:hypothetical protein